MMSRKRLIDVDKLLFDDELIEVLGIEGLWIYPILWSIAEDWGGYEPKYGSIALRSGALRFTKEAVQKAIDILIDLGKIIPYQVNGKTYHWIKSFFRWKPLYSPSPPDIPLPPWIKWRCSSTSSSRGYFEFQNRLSGDES